MDVKDREHTHHHSSPVILRNLTFKFQDAVACCAINDLHRLLLTGHADSTCFEGCKDARRMII